MKISDSPAVSNLSAGTASARPEAPQSKGPSAPALPVDQSNAAVKFEVPNGPSVSIENIELDSGKEPWGGGAAEGGLHAHNGATKTTGVVIKRDRA